MYLLATKIICRDIKNKKISYGKLELPVSLLDETKNPNDIITLINDKYEEILSRRTSIAERIENYKTAKTTREQKHLEFSEKLDTINDNKARAKSRSLGNALAGKGEIGIGIDIEDDDDNK